MSLETIRLSEAAQTYLISQIAARGKGKGVRLKITDAGCSGKQYLLDYVDEIDPKDHVFKMTEGFYVVVDPESYPFIKGTEIDYIENGLSKTFVYRNPNQTGLCGCGESFSVD